MSLSHVVPQVSLVAMEAEKISHWIIGAIALVILMSLLGALLAFGGGREHS